MFDHLQRSDARTPRVNRTALLAAIALALPSLGLVVYACLWVLSVLGFTNIIAPVEVSYDPFGDGTRLDDLLGTEERPTTLLDSGGLDLLQGPTEPPDAE